MLLELSEKWLWIGTSSKSVRLTGRIHPHQLTIELMATRVWRQARRRDWLNETAQDLLPLSRRIARSEICVRGPKCCAQSC